MGRGSGDPYAEGVEDTEVGYDLWEDTGVLGFWYPRIMCVVDVRMVDTDSDTYAGIQPHKVQTRYGWRKKRKYLDACLGWRLHFTPMVLSVDGFMGYDTKADTKQLAAALTNKWY